MRWYRGLLVAGLLIGALGTLPGCEESGVGIPEPGADLDEAAHDAAPAKPPGQ